MKKILSLVAFAAALCSCQKEVNKPVESQATSTAKLKAPVLALRQPGDTNNSSGIIYNDVGCSISQNTDGTYSGMCGSIPIDFSQIIFRTGPYDDNDPVAAISPTVRNGYGAQAYIDRVNGPFFDLTFVRQTIYSEPQDMTDDFTSFENSVGQTQTIYYPRAGSYVKTSYTGWTNTTYMLKVVRSINGGYKIVGADDYIKIPES